MINYTVQLRNMIVYNLGANCSDLYGTRNTVVSVFFPPRGKEMLPTHGKAFEASAWESTYCFVVRLGIIWEARCYREICKPMSYLHVWGQKVPEVSFLSLSAFYCPTRGRTCGINDLLNERTNYCTVCIHLDPGIPGSL